MVLPVFRADVAGFGIRLAVPILSIREATTWAISASLGKGGTLVGRIRIDCRNRDASVILTRNEAVRIMRLIAVCDSAHRAVVAHIVAPPQQWVSFLNVLTFMNVVGLIIVPCLCSVTICDACQHFLASGPEGCGGAVAVNGIKRDITVLDRI